MRFLQTSDWQMGMKAAQLGSMAAKAREARLDSARRVVDLARSEQVDFVLLAGDTFEDAGVSRGLVRQVGEILGSLDCPVYLLPGNHDPLGPGSVWEHPVWDSRANLRVLTSSAPVPVSGGVLLPCPLSQRWSDADPTASIPLEPSSGIRVGVAHGTLDYAGVEDPEGGHPIACDAWKRARVDYLAIGHWHSRHEVLDTAGAVRMAYSGTHEATKFGERDSGGVLLVTIDAPGSAPRSEARSTGTLRWEQVTGLPAEVESRLAAIPDPARTLVEVRLAGLLEAGERERLRRIQEGSLPRFLFARYDDKELIPSPQDDAWVESLPAGPARDCATQLRSRAAGGTDPVASRALLTLFRLKEEQGL
jgi:DNA repair exonuclease SbcCD nuclease subunit